MTTFGRATWYRWEKLACTAYPSPPNKTLVPAEEIDQ